MEQASPGSGASRGRGGGHTGEIPGSLPANYRPRIRLKAIAAVSGRDDSFVADAGARHFFRRISQCSCGACHRERTTRISNWDDGGAGDFAGRGGYGVREEVHQAGAGAAGWESVASREGAGDSPEYFEQKGGGV